MNRIILVILLLLLFLFSRLYNITNTLEFFGDIGRDHLVLWQWWQTSKVPLLGPGISYFPLHLPPIYFYLNYPIFVITHFSPFSTLITLIAIYIGMFLIGFKFLKELEWKKFLILAAFLVIFHPQYILQTRLPWNPTFAPPFLFLSVISLILMTQKVTLKLAFLFSIGIAIAVGLSVQVVPVALILIVSAFILCAKRKKLVLSIFSAFFLIFSPLLFFEIRHNFFFVRRLLLDFVTQPFSTDMALKLKQQSAFLFGIFEWNIFSLLLLGIVFVLIFVNIFITFKKKSENLHEKRIILLSVLFVSSFLLTYLMPFPTHEYDIFGTSVLLFSLIALLPLRSALIIVIIFSMIWVNTENFTLYNRLARRNVAQMDVCAKKICEFEKEPMFIATEAWHIYHKTPEWQFFFSKSGCSVNDITEQPDWTSKMAVIADNTIYQHRKTAFNELTLFGSSKEQNIYQCDGNIRVHILEK